MTIFSGITRVSRRNLLDFMVQGNIIEADTPTIRLGATLSGLISHPPPSSPIFTPDALPATTLPIYLGLGQAPNMLACIPSGLVPRSANHIKHILLLALPPHHTTPQWFTVLWPFFRNHPGEPMPEENFWTLWCKGRLTEADTQTI